MKERKKSKLIAPDPVYVQPSKCVGCVWGRFDGMKQYCMRYCVKEPKKR